MKPSVRGCFWYLPPATAERWWQTRWPPFSPQRPKKCGFKDKGYICYEEDAQESVVLRELLDKKLWKIPDRIKDKGQFEEKLNQSIRQYHPEYWRARQSGREAAEAARSTAPAKEAAR